MEGLLSVLGAAANCQCADCKKAREGGADVKAAEKKLKEALENIKTVSESLKIKGYGKEYSDFVLMIRAFDISPSILSAINVINREISNPVKLLRDEAMNIVSVLNDDMEAIKPGKVSYDKTAVKEIKKNKASLAFVLFEHCSDIDPSIEFLFKEVIQDNIVEKAIKEKKKKSLSFEVNFDFMTFDSSSKKSMGHSHCVNLVSKSYSKSGKLRYGYDLYYVVLEIVQKRFPNFELRLVNSKNKFHFKRLEHRLVPAQELLQKFKQVFERFEKEYPIFMKEYCESFDHEFTRCTCAMLENMIPVSVFTPHTVQFEMGSPGKITFVMPAMLVKFYGILEYLGIHTSVIKIGKKPYNPMMLNGTATLTERSGKLYYKRIMDFVCRIRDESLAYLKGKYEKGYEIEHFVKLNYVEGTYLTNPTKDAYSVQIQLDENPEPPRPLDYTIEATDVEHEQCTICATNKKNIALKCGHVYCYECIKKLSECPNKCSGGFCDMRVVHF